VAERWRDESEERRSQASEKKKKDAAARDKLLRHAVLAFGLEII
jgi:hypothetical protein